MSKRLLVLFALLLVASVFSSAVAHACPDLKSVQAMLETPCDHNSSQDSPRRQKEKDNCDSVRYGLLSTQASPSQAQLFKLHAILVPHALPVSVTLPDVLPLFSRSQAPPYHGFGVSLHSSHVVLRI